MALSIQIGNTIGEWLKIRLAKEFRDQGHNLSGALIASLEKKVVVSGEKMTIQMLGNDYGDPLNTGVPASRIPYTPDGPRRGGTSQYIQALIRYAQRRMGLQGKEATSAAFAIARKQKREGMPTKGSFKYSSNGRRTGWVDVALEENEAELEKFVNEWVGKEITLLIENFVKDRN